MILGGREIADNAPKVCTEICPGTSVVQRAPNRPGSLSVEQLQSFQKLWVTTVLELLGGHGVFGLRKQRRRTGS